MTHETVTDKSMRKKGWILCSEAARHIDKSVQTLYRWIDAGKVAGLKTGDYRRFIKWNDMLDHLGPEVAEAKGLKRM